MDKAVGRAKEAYGALVGDEAKKAEGHAEQRKAEAEAEARQREKTRRAEAEARQAEKERDRQRLKDKGPLGGIAHATEDLGGLTDKLSGRLEADRSGRVFRGLCPGEDRQASTEEEAYGPTRREQRQGRQRQGGDG
jgi:uncharacterized protein YjbJ (UPF0337 family)